VEIKAWLEGLALAEYEPAFRDHQITVDVLGDLSDDELRSIGIAPLGARKRLLKAIPATAPGSIDAATTRSFSARVHRRRRRTDVITSTCVFVMGRPLGVVL
jgi:SAM domain (Sterile alpha motif)